MSESDAVRKVALYLHHLDQRADKKVTDYYIQHAKAIVKLVHESEDADE